MIGIVAALFCTLIIAGISSYCFNLDLKWYFALNKPHFVVSSGWFAFFVAVNYASCILALSRLVEHKHLFPSMLFFLILGASDIMFLLFFFRLKIILAAAFFITASQALAYTLFVRFMMKDFKIALEFLPAFLFHCYAFICALSIVMLN